MTNDERSLYQMMADVLGLPQIEHAPRRPALTIPLPELARVDFTAGIYNAAGITAARANFSRLAPGWCDCQSTAPQAYWENPHTSARGWMCAACRRTTQQG